MVSWIFSLLSWVMMLKLSYEWLIGEIMNMWTPMTKTRNSHCGNALYTRTDYALLESLEAAHLLSIIQKLETKKRRNIFNEMKIDNKILMFVGIDFNGFGHVTIYQHYTLFFIQIKWGHITRSLALHLNNRWLVGRWWKRT